MKRTLAFLLALSMMFVLIACGQQPTTPTTTPASQQEQPAEQPA